MAFVHTEHFHTAVQQAPLVSIWIWYIPSLTIKKCSRSRTMVSTHPYLLKQVMLAYMLQLQDLDLTLEPTPVEQTMLAHSSETASRWHPLDRIRKN